MPGSAQPPSGTRGVCHLASSRCSQRPSPRPRAERGRQLRHASAAPVRRARRSCSHSRRRIRRSAALGLALGASLLDRAAVARVARAAAERALRLQRRGRLHGRAHAAGRAARAGAGRSRASGRRAPRQRAAAAQAGRSPERRAARARRARCRARLARPAAGGARRSTRSSCTSCASSSARGRRSWSRCRPCARCCALKHGRLRPARARAARQAARAGVERARAAQRARARGLARVLEEHAAHRAAGRAALARADGRADLGLAVERHGPGPSRRRRPSSSPKATELALSTALRRARRRARVGRVRPLRAAQAARPRGRRASPGVALWVRGGRVVGDLASAALGTGGRRSALAVARRAREGRERVAPARHQRLATATAPVEHHDGAADETAHDHATGSPQAASARPSLNPAVGDDGGDDAEHELQRDPVVGQSRVRVEDRHGLPGDRRRPGRCPRRRSRPPRGRGSSRSRA